MLDGVPHVCKLTLGALAELEAALAAENLLDLIRRFEDQAFSSGDVLAVVVAGLRGGGWQGTAEDLMTVEIAGGAVAAAQAAAMMIARAFALPD